MIDFRILNKSKPSTVLLIHGLFTSCGYWLPYLSSLKNHRLIILDIDYHAIHDIDQYVSRVVEIIATEGGGAVDAVISHSLGSLISSQLPQDACHSLFEVCPVYCATRINADQFIDNIERMIKFSMVGDEIRELLKRVDSAIAVHVPRASSSVRQSVYLPDADVYFSYRASPSAMKFKGDHFDISEALEDIRKVLSS